MTIRVKIVFHDDSWMICRSLSWWEIFESRITETQGTHHWYVQDMSGEYKEVYKDIIGQRIAVPINSMKYMVIL